MNPRTPLSALRAATLIAIIAGVLATLSYAVDAPRYIRAENSPLGAWLDGYEFQIMEGAATALGLLLGVRIAARLSGAAQYRWWSVGLAILVAIAALIPLMIICQAAARLGWNGNSATVASWIAGYGGYTGGRELDKVLIAGVYFLKTTALALLAGTALAGLVIGIPTRVGSVSASEASSHGPRDAA
jgi:hypothetical protein